MTSQSKHSPQKGVSYAELKQMQALPLKFKIRKSEQRIQEWYDSHQGNVTISFSGGLDSTVLSHIVHNLISKDVTMVFSNTGVEYRVIVDFVKQHHPVEIVRPEHSFKWVLDNYGYPVVSKRVSRFINDCQRAKEADNAATVNLRLTGRNQKGAYCPSMKIPEKWKYLIDAPFKISDACCDWIKKKTLR